MFFTLIAGISLLIISGVAETYMSYTLLKDIQDIPGKNNC